MSRFNKNDYVVVSAKNLKTTGEKGLITEIFLNVVEAEMATVKLDNGKTIQIRTKNIERIEPEEDHDIEEETDRPATMSDVHDHVDQTTNHIAHVLLQIDEIVGRRRVYNPSQEEVEYLIETSHGFFNITLGADEFCVEIDELLNEGEEFISSELIPPFNEDCITVKTKDGGRVDYWYDKDMYRTCDALFTHLEEQGYNPYIYD